MQSMSRDEVLTLLQGQPRAKNRRKANLGRAFEDMVSIVNRQYRAERIARIDKVPTAFKPIRDAQGIIGVKVEEKALVDYIGGYHGRPIAFDAKHTSGGRMRLEELKPHQADYLRDNQEINGGISFILVSFRLQRFFVVPWCEWRDERISDLRSFTADDLKPEWECRQGRHVAVDYLAVVDYLYDHRFG